MKESIHPKKMVCVNFKKKNIHKKITKKNEYVKETKIGISKKKSCHRYSKLTFHCHKIFPRNTPCSQGIWKAIRKVTKHNNSIERLESNIKVKI